MRKSRHNKLAEICLWAEEARRLLGQDPPKTLIGLIDDIDQCIDAVLSGGDPGEKAKLADAGAIDLEINPTTMEECLDAVCRLARSARTEAASNRTTNFALINSALKTVKFRLLPRFRIQAAAFEWVAPPPEFMP